MLIGHLPAGYLLGNFVRQSPFITKTLRAKCFLACLIGAVFPDIDMLYFYLIDNRQHHHHSYFTHLPITWIIMLAVGLVWRRLSNEPGNATVFVLFTLAGIVHLLLDTIVGDVWWLFPLIDQPFALFTVTDRFDPWWLNFIIHWSFLLELAMWMFALLVWAARRYN